MKVFKANSNWKLLPLLPSPPKNAGSIEKGLVFDLGPVRSEEHHCALGLWGWLCGKVPLHLSDAYINAYICGCFLAPFQHFVALWKLKNSSIQVLQTPCGVSKLRAKCTSQQCGEEGNHHCKASLCFFWFLISIAKYFENIFPQFIL